MCVCMRACVRACVCVCVCASRMLQVCTISISVNPLYEAIPTSVYFFSVISLYAIVLGEAERG